MVNWNCEKLPSCIKRKKLPFHIRSQKQKKGFCRGKGSFFLLIQDSSFLKIAVPVEQDRLYFLSSAFFSLFLCHIAIEKIPKK
jgi:hypothetical protein